MSVSEKKPSRCVCSTTTLGSVGHYREVLSLVQELLKRNAKVYLAARNATKANTAISELKVETGKEAIFLQLDLADIPAVRKSAEEFLSWGNFLVITEFLLTFLPERRRSCTFSSITRKWRESVKWTRVTNGDGVDRSGVMIPPVEEITVQKYDMQFGTNVVGVCRCLPSSNDSASLTRLVQGHWLFTKLLLPALLAVTDASPTREKARVVTVSSGASYLTNDIDFEAITDGSKRRKYDPWNLYFKSKLVGVNNVPFLVVLLTGSLALAACRVML